MIYKVFIQVKVEDEEMMKDVTVARFGKEFISNDD